MCAGAFAGLFADHADALSLNGFKLQSGLGQPLRAQLEIGGSDAGDLDLACYKAYIQTPDGAMLSPLNLSLVANGAHRTLRLSSNKSIGEPAVSVVLQVACEVQTRREFTVLLDPPELDGRQAVAIDSELPVRSAGSAAKVPAAEPASPSPRVRARLPVGQNSAQQERPAGQSASARKNTASDKAVHTAQEIKKDTLRLSEDPLPAVQTVPSGGLKISDSLSESGAVHQNMAELRLAQAQFAAMLRGEDTVITGDKTQADEKKLQNLQKEHAQLQQKLQQDKAVIDELKEGSVPKSWLYALLALIAACAAVIGLLFLYLRRSAGAAVFRWWEHAAQEPQVVEPKRNISELVDHVQATYAVTNSDVVVPDSAVEQVSSILAKRQTGPLQAATSVPAAPGLGRLDSPSVFGRSGFTPSLEDTNSSTFNFFSNRHNTVKVEEISDVTQEAEFWMSVNDPERAIEILEPQAEVEQPDSPVPWLYLLDLYKLVDNREKYDNLRDRFTVYFNAQIPEFDVDIASLPVRHLDDFEHLIRKICSVWNTNNILPLLESLLVDDRNGTRMGFELPVYRDILLLIAVAHELERSRPFAEPELIRPAALHPQESQEAHGLAAAPDLLLELPPAEAQPARENNLIDFEPIEFGKK